MKGVWLLTEGLTQDKILKAVYVVVSLTPPRPTLSLHCQLDGLQQVREGIHKIYI